MSEWQSRKPENEWTRRSKKYKAATMAALKGLYGASKEAKDEHMGTRVDKPTEEKDRP